MSMKSIALCLAGLAMISGCATSDKYALAEPASDQAAFIASTFERESTFVWIRIVPVTIDDKYVEVSGWTGLPADTIKAPSGPHKISVELTFNRGFGSPQLGSQISFESNLGIGASYTLRGRVTGMQAEAWLDDTTGKIASTVGRSSLGTTTASQTPIFIPMPAR